MKGTLGIVGLGIMGGAIGTNLVAAGWRVVGFDLDADACARAKSAGIEVVASAANVAQACADILTSLPSPKALIATAQAIAASGAPRRVVIEASTMALDDKFAFERILTEAGHVALDCTLSGTGAQAAVKDLVTLASGPSAEIARLMPMFLDFGRKAYDLGDFGNGSKMKYVANLLVTIHNVAAAEAIVLGMKAGLDPHQIVEVVASGAGSSRMFEVRGPLMADGVYEPPTMRNSTYKKDLTVIGEFANALDCPTPLFNATLPIYQAALGIGMGGQDTAAVCAVLEMMAGMPRGPGKAASTSGGKTG